MKLKKLNLRGFSHDIMLVLFVMIFAVGGVGYLVASHADNCSTPVSGDVSGTVSETTSEAASDSTSDTSCTTPASSPASGTTTTPPTVSAPTNLQATQTNGNSFTLVFGPGSVSAGDQISGYQVFGYNLNSASSTATKYGQVASSSSTSFTYHVTGLTPASSYGFYVKTYDVSGNLSAASASVQVHTSLALGTVTNLSASSTTSNSTVLSWSPAQDNVGSTINGYDIYRYLASAGESSAVLYSKNVASTKPQVVGLNPATAYGFVIQAHDAAGNYSVKSTPVLVTTLPASSTAAISVSPLSLTYTHANIVNTTLGYTTMYWTSTGTGSFTLPTTITGVTVVAKGDQCVGAPQMVVKVDNQTAMNQAVAATSFTSYSSAINVGKGTHTISVSFTNDHDVTGVCDRNLYVKSISFHP